MTLSLTATIAREHEKPIANAGIFPTWEMPMMLEEAFRKGGGTFSAPHPATDGDDWVAASDTYNYCIEDPLIDWLCAYGESAGFLPDAGDRYDVRTDYRRFITAKARQFESKAIEWLSARYNVVPIGGDAGNARHRSLVEATWKAMEAGAEIIAHGVLWNPETKVLGVPDLLVRSDVLARMFSKDLGVSEASGAAPGLPHLQVHYRVVDVKYTTLDLKKDGHASASHLKYMVQVWLYNEALGRLQGITPTASYLLGRRWTCGELRGKSAFERLARVDRNAEVKPIGLPAYATAACEWVRSARRDGGRWRVLPTPSVPELWPNMREKSERWHGAKLDIAHKLEDLTLIPRVNPEKRNDALVRGISRWTDPSCHATSLGIMGEKVAPVVNAVLRANRSPASGPVVFPARVKVNENNWRTPVPCEFYVDFETVSDLDDDFEQFPEPAGQPLIFMIGCGHYIPTPQGPQWVHRILVVDHLTLAEERRVIEEWMTYMTATCEGLGVSLPDARLFHWSPAETATLTTSYNAAHKRHASPSWPRLPWIDLLNDVVKEQPVTVRGAFGFGLKAIANAMHDHGLIQTRWESGPTDGLGAMVGAWWCHHEATKQGLRMGDLDLMKGICEYNEVDCKAMAEVLGYLRRER